jgi:hypothetical protein
VNLVDTLAASMRWALGMFGRPLVYQQQGGPNAILTVYMRGVRADDLFAGAMQQDVAAVVDAAAFRAAFSLRLNPARFDRLRLDDGTTFAVEAWRGSPSDDAPVFFKLLLRGGQQ